MLENHLYNDNITHLTYEIKQSKKLISSVKKEIGKPFNKFEYYGVESVSKIPNVLDKLEKHYFFDEMYFVKMVGLLESLHIHLFSYYIINNEKFKNHSFNKFEVLSTKGHMTGYISKGGVFGKEDLRINSDEGFTDYIATRFFPGKIPSGCLNALNLLSERTLNENVYNKIFNENYRINFFNNSFEEINQLHIDKNKKPLFFFKNTNDFINISEVISELRNRFVHRNFQYDIAAIVTVKNEKFTNFKKEELFSNGNAPTLQEIYPNATAKEIKKITEKLHSDEDLSINDDLVNYLIEKELLKEPHNPKYFAYNDNNILQFLSCRMDEIVLESLFIHQCMYDKFMLELKNKSA